MKLPVRSVLLMCGGGVVAVAIVLFFLVVMAPATWAISSETPMFMTTRRCFNNSIVEMNYTFNITNMTGDTRQIDFTQQMPCNTGCSTTFNDCRVNPFLEIVYMAAIFAGLLLFSAFSIWLERKTNTSIDVPLLILISLFSIIIGTQDIFTGTYRILFFLFSIIPLVLLWFARREVPDYEEGEPIDVEVK